jgi:AraC-like DNA-binding protein
MDREKLVDRLFAVWNAKDVPELLKLMHPQASYYDAFWQESCSGKHLAKFFETNFALDTRWYKPVGPIIPTPNGLISRYAAFESDDPEGLVPIMNGAEIITISDGLIITISDYYCDPDPIELAEIAVLAEGQHGRINVVQRGLSAKTSGRIKRRLVELATDLPVILDPSLTVTKLAHQSGCSVMHLFHVLEELKNTTFLKYVGDCRARYAATLIVDAADGDIRFDQIAEQCGFQSVEEFNIAFHATFDISAHTYRQKFRK